MSLIPLSVQLWTLRDEIANDLAGTLKQVASFGYKNVELAGFNNLTATEYKAILDDAGLAAPSAHVPIDALNSDGQAKVLDDYATMGAKSLIIPWVGEDWRGEDGYKRLAETLNTLGEKVVAAGFEFSYHNHDFEFTDQFDGKYALDLILENTDPKLVHLELDTYWAKFAGADPVKVIETYADRTTLLHIKDGDSENVQIPVADPEGTLPVDALIAVANKVGVKLLVVELDHSTKQSAPEAVRLSFENLKAKGYV